eukprot:366013-Chlamydomonas_euryale.AAC.13
MHSDDPAVGCRLRSQRIRKVVGVRHDSLGAGRRRLELLPRLRVELGDAVHAVLRMLRGHIAASLFRDNMDEHRADRLSRLDLRQD